MINVKGKISGRILSGLCAASMLALAMPAVAQEPAQRLYKGKAPGSERWTRTQTKQARPGGGDVYFNTVDPDLTAYPADPVKANGTAVILLPGGGLRQLGIGAEARDTIARFNQEGISVFVLKYRTLQMNPPAKGPRARGENVRLPKLVIRNGNANPSPDDPALNEVLKLATDDAQLALKMVRAQAAKYKIDPKRVGMIGSSAGGGVALGAVIEQEPGAAPDFVISLYGPSLQDVTVPADAPPLFIATESDHGPVTDGLLALFSLWKDAGKKVELHVFEVPNFQMPPALWIDRAVAWMGEQKLIPTSTHP